MNWAVIVFWFFTALLHGISSSDGLPVYPSHTRTTNTAKPTTNTADNDSYYVWLWHQLIYVHLQNIWYTIRLKQGMEVKFWNQDTPAYGNGSGYENDQTIVFWSNLSNTTALSSESNRIGIFYWTYQVEETILYKIVEPQIFWLYFTKTILTQIFLSPKETFLRVGCSGTFDKIEKKLRKCWAWLKFYHLL